MINITKLGKTLKSKKIYDNFRLNLHWKAKIIINFLDLNVFSIFVIFIFQLDTNFSSLRPKSAYFFGFICQKKCQFRP